MKSSIALCFAACCVLANSNVAGAALPDDSFDTPTAATAPDASTAATATDTRPKTESPISRDYLKLIWLDTKETATEPLRWDGDDWRNFGLITGGLVLTAAFADKPIRDAAQRNRSAGSDKFFKQVERFGTKQYGLPVMAAFYGYGAFADDDESKQVALDGFSADVISALFTSTMKGIVGRARPNSGHGPGHFDPLKGDYSFPSGHATGAFAFASVIASHYDSPWVDATAYGVAGLVGIARIHLDAHWTSDVIAGALIGNFIGRHLVAFNRTVRANGFSLRPTVGSDGNQMTLTWSF
jgi:hypothetical protein